MKYKIILITLFFNCILAQIKNETFSLTFKSAILPGWGELELKNIKRSNQFFIQEGIIWISFFSSIPIIDRLFF